MGRTPQKPENDIYLDNGCNVSPSCLRCPLAQCKYDATAPYLAWTRSTRYQQLLGMEREGLTTNQISERLNLSVRGVARLRDNYRKDRKLGLTDLEQTEVVNHD